MVMGKKSSMTAVSAFFGIAAFLLDVVGTLVLGFLKPGYDPIAMTVSELGESGGANYLAAGVLFILTGICEVVFAVGLYARSNRKLPALIGALCIAGHGIFDQMGSGLFPCDLGGKYDSAFGQIHFAVSVIGVALILCAPFFVWRADKKRLTLAFAVIIAAGVGLFGVSFFTESFVGLTQRLFYWAYFLWILLLSVSLLRPAAGTSGTE